MSINKNILLKQGNIVNENSNFVSDLLIEDDKILRISHNIEADTDTSVFNAKGMFVIPGGIDPSTHFATRFNGIKTIDDFYYGTRAAVSGGTTMIIDYIVPDGGKSLEQAYRKRRKDADSEVVCDYSLHMILNCWDEKISREMDQLALGCGINSFMMYMSHNYIHMFSDQEFYQACYKCRKLGILAMIHAENGSIVKENEKKLLYNNVKGPEGHYLARPEILQAEATNRACVIANQVQCPLYIRNVMSESAAEIIRNYKEQGYTVFAETIAAALGKTAPPANAKFPIASNFITSPPLSRNKTTPTYLMRKLKNGVLTTTASNHCTFTSDQKARGYKQFTHIPHGVNGVEERMAVIWEKGVNSGILTPSQFVAVTSTNAAKLFNLYPKKGAIKEGSDADIVVWNPQRFNTILNFNQQQICDFNIFQGMKILGGPQYVFVRGRLCVDGDILYVERGYGKYIHRKRYSQLAYSGRNLTELQQDDFGVHEHF